MREEFDPATKIWTTVFGVIAMLLIQWPAFFAQRLHHPPRDGSAAWNTVAALVGLAVPATWLIGDLRRFRLGLRWVVTLLVVAAWVVVSFVLIHR